MQTLIDHPAASVITLFSLVALTFIAKRLGLIAWLAWLDRRKEERRGEEHRKENHGRKDRWKENRGRRERNHGRHSEGSGEYWSIHQ